MILNWTAILIGALGGFVAAVKIDYDAFKAHPNVTFDWKLALGRWVMGAVLGATAAMGVVNAAAADTSGV